MLTLIARCVRGLEWVVASELEALLDATVLDVSHRELRFRVPQLTTELLSIGSVDDLFIPWGTICNIDHTRASLNTLTAAISAIGMVEALTQVKGLRQPSQNFDVVASYLGRHNYSRFDIEDAVGPALARVINGTYVSRRAGPMPRTTLSFRIHISERTAQLSVRLAEFPLHRRAYKVGSQRGTLIPPLAYCMAMIAGVSDDTRLLDPFCGVGTIVIESSRVAPYASLLGTEYRCQGNTHGSPQCSVGPMQSGVYQNGRWTAGFAEQLDGKNYQQYAMGGHGRGEWFFAIDF